MAVSLPARGTVPVPLPSTSQGASQASARSGPWPHSLSQAQAAQGLDSRALTAHFTSLPDVDDSSSALSMDEEAVGSSPGTGAGAGASFILGALELQPGPEVRTAELRHILDEHGLCSCGRLQVPRPVRCSLKRRYREPRPCPGYNHSCSTGAHAKRLLPGHVPPPEEAASVHRVPGSIALGSRVMRATPFNAYSWFHQHNSMPGDDSDPVLLAQARAMARAAEQVEAATAAQSSAAAPASTGPPLVHGHVQDLSVLDAQYYRPGIALGLQQQAAQDASNAALSSLKSAISGTGDGDGDGDRDCPPSSSPFSGGSGEEPGSATSGVLSQAQAQTQVQAYGPPGKRGVAKMSPTDAAVRKYRVDISRPFVNRTHPAACPVFLRRNVRDSRFAWTRTLYSSVLRSIRIHREIRVSMLVHNLKNYINRDRKPVSTVGSSSSSSGAGTGTGAEADVEAMAGGIGKMPAYVASGLKAGQAHPYLIERMRSICGLRRGDLLVDVGHGEGAAVLACAALTGCMAYGVEVVPQRAELSFEVLHTFLTMARSGRDSSAMCGEPYLGMPTNGSHGLHTPANAPDQTDPLQTAGLYASQQLGEDAKASSAQGKSVKRARRAAADSTRVSTADNTGAGPDAPSQPSTRLIVRASSPHSLQHSTSSPGSGHLRGGSRTPSFSPATSVEATTPPKPGLWVRPGVGVAAGRQQGAKGGKKGQSTAGRTGDDELPSEATQAQDREDGPHDESDSDCEPFYKQGNIEPLAELKPAGSAGLGSTPGVAKRGPGRPSKQGQARPGKKRARSTTAEEDEQHPSDGVPSLTGAAEAGLTQSTVARARQAGRRFWPVAHTLDPDVSEYLTAESIDKLRTSGGRGAKGSSKDVLGGSPQSIYTVSTSGSSPSSASPLLDMRASHTGSGGGARDQGKRKQGASPVSLSPSSSMATPARGSGAVASPHARSSLLKADGTPTEPLLGYLQASDVPATIHCLGCAMAVLTRNPHAEHHALCPLTNALNVRHVAYAQRFPTAVPTMACARVVKVKPLLYESSARTQKSAAQARRRVLSLFRGGCGSAVPSGGGDVGVDVTNGVLRTPVTHHPFPLGRDEVTRGKAEGAPPVTPHVGGVHRMAIKGVCMRMSGGLGGSVPFPDLHLKNGYPYDSEFLGAASLSASQSLLQFPRPGKGYYKYECDDPTWGDSFRLQLRACSSGPSPSPSPAASSFSTGTGTGAGAGARAAPRRDATSACSSAASDPVIAPQLSDTLPGWIPMRDRVFFEEGDALHKLSGPLSPLLGLVCRAGLATTLPYSLRGVSGRLVVLCNNYENAWNNVGQGESFQSRLLRLLARHVPAGSIIVSLTQMTRPRESTAHTVAEAAQSRVSALLGVDYSGASGPCLVSPWPPAASQSVTGHGKKAAVAKKRSSATASSEAKDALSVGSAPSVQQQQEEEGQHGGAGGGLRTHADWVSIPTGTQAFPVLMDRMTSGKEANNGSYIRSNLYFEVSGGWPVLPLHRAEALTSSIALSQSDRDFIRGLADGVDFGREEQQALYENALWDGVVEGVWLRGRQRPEYAAAAAVIAMRWSEIQAVSGGTGITDATYEHPSAASAAAAASLGNYALCSPEESMRQCLAMQIPGKLGAVWRKARYTGNSPPTATNPAQPMPPAQPTTVGAGSSTWHYSEYVHSGHHYYGSGSHHYPSGSGSGAGGEGGEGEGQGKRRGRPQKVRASEPGEDDDDSSSVASSSASLVFKRAPKPKPAPPETPPPKEPTPPLFTFGQIIRVRKRPDGIVRVMAVLGWDTDEEDNMYITRYVDPSSVGRHHVYADRFMAAEETRREQEYEAVPPDYCFKHGLLKEVPAGASMPAADAAIVLEGQEQGQAPEAEGAAAQAGASPAVSSAVYSVTDGWEARVQREWIGHAKEWDASLILHGAPGAGAGGAGAGAGAGGSDSGAALSVAASRPRRGASSSTASSMPAPTPSARALLRLCMPWPYVLHEPVFDPLTPALVAKHAARVEKRRKEEAAKVAGDTAKELDMDGTGAPAAAPGAQAQGGEEGAKMECAHGAEAGTGTTDPNPNTGAGSDIGRKGR